jgi:transposase
MSGIRNALIDEGLRLEILSESGKAGAVISEVARRYGVSPGAVYGWRTQARKSASKSGSTISAPVDFIEFKAVSQQPPQPGFGAKISKVSVTFTNFELSLEGGISASGLSQILAVLEAEC